MTCSRRMYLTLVVFFCGGIVGMISSFRPSIQRRVWVVGPGLPTTTTTTNQCRQSTKIQAHSDAVPTTTTAPLLFSRRLQQQQHQQQGERQNNFLVQTVMNRWISRYRSKIRRSFLILVMVVSIFLGMMSLGSLPAQAASSSSVPTTTTTTPISLLRERIETMLPRSPSLDTIVDRYVQKHMFDDDAFDDDPTASTYREAYHDSMVGTYPKALREITSSVLGESRAVGDYDGDAQQGGFLLGFLLKNLRKRGFNEMAAVGFLTTLVFVAAPMVFLFSTMTVGLFFKRNIRREMKARYGEGYTLDATVKKDEEVEAPDDDDDDDDDDNDDQNDDEDKNDTKKED